MIIYFGWTVSMGADQNILLSHICSECHNPILNVASIHAEASAHFFFLQKAAENRCEEKVDSKLHEQMEKVKAWAANGEKVSSVDKLDFLKNGRGVCPVCQRRERWMLSASERGSAPLELDSAPVFRPTQEEAEEWVSNYAQRVVKERAEYWRANRQRGKQLWEEYRKLSEELSLLQDRMAAFLKTEGITQLRAEIARCTETSESDDASSSDRRKAKRRAKELTTSLNEKQRSCVERVKEFNTKIQELERSRTELATMMYGLTGEINLVRNGTAYCYQII